MKQGLHSQVTKLQLLKCLQVPWMHIKSSHFENSQFSPKLQSLQRHLWWTFSSTPKGLMQVIFVVRQSPFLSQGLGSQPFIFHSQWVPYQFSAQTHFLFLHKSVFRYFLASFRRLRILLICVSILSLHQIS